MENFEKLVAICKGHKIYIQPHNFPDPDAIGSAYGLKSLLNLYDIDAHIIYEGRVDKLSTLKMFDIFDIPYSTYEEIKENLSEDNYIICIDSQKGGGNITNFIGNEIAAIDHHPTYKEIDYLYKDIRPVGACATIISQYFETLGKVPDEKTATALLYGIKMDTLQFSRGVTMDDIKAFEFLFPYVNQDTLIALESNNMEFDDLKAYGAAIENVKAYGHIAFSGMPFNCPDAMIGILSDFMLSLVEVDIAVLYSKRESGWKFSIRSECRDVHAGEVIHNALEGIGNGGGHAEMAGGFVPISEIEKMGHYPDDVIRQRFLDQIDDKYEV